MAGNNLIKLLRCTSTTRANSTEILLNGQPLVEQDTHLIYVGDGTTEAKNLTPYGGGGAQLEDNCVLYSELQTLTDEQKEQARININAQTANLFFKNVQVPANSFVADTTYDDYPFRATIVLSGVTDTMVPNVCFGVAQATDANYAPVADSYNGGVYLYAKKTNDALFSIPFISLEVTE